MTCDRQRQSNNQEYTDGHANSIDTMRNGQDRTKEKQGHAGQQRLTKRKKGTEAKTEAETDRGRDRDRQRQRQRQRQSQRQRQRQRL